MLKLDEVYLKADSRQVRLQLTNKSTTFKHIMTRVLIASFLLVSFVAVQANEESKRKNLVKCINAELEKENSEFKLKDDELKKLKEIVDKEIMKEPLKKHNKDEQEKILKEIEASAKKELPDVTTDTVDKMMNKLKGLGMHCCKEMGS